MILQRNFLSKSFSFSKSALIALLATGFLSACAQKERPTTITYSNSRVIDTKDIERQILYYINQYRSSMGLNALQMIPAADEQASKHSAEMAKRATPFGHDGFDERIDNIVKKIGFVHASAENVAYGKLTAKEVVDLWLNSPGHKRNIEGNYALTGIGVAKDPDGLLFYTQIFLRK